MHSDCRPPQGGRFSFAYDEVRVDMSSLPGIERRVDICYGGWRALQIAVASLAVLTLTFSGCQTGGNTSAAKPEQAAHRDERNAPSAGWPRTFPNAHGPDVVLEKPALNIISLQPNVAEMVVAIGGHSSLLAVDRYTAYPPEAASKPKIGDILSPDYEKIVSMQPDLIITSRGTPEDVLSKLRDLGFQVLGVDPEGLDDVFSCMKMFGRIIGIETVAADVTAQLQRRREAVMTQVAEAVAGHGQPRTLFVLAMEPLFIAGPSSFIASMIEEAGGRQAYQATQGFANQPWPQVSKETVLAVAPDVLIFSVGQTDADTSESTANCLAQLRKDAAWAQVPAVKEGRVYVMDEDLITIPGPRLVEGLEQMAEFLHPSSATEPQ